MREKIRARLDVEPDRRLVEQQHARAMQQRAGDLDAPHLAAGKVAHLVCGAVRQSRPARGQPRRAAFASRAEMSMQRGVIGEILRDREIEIEGSRLEHDAKPAQRFAGRAVHIETENTDDASSRADRGA